MQATLLVYGVCPPRRLVLLASRADAGPVARAMPDRRPPVTSRPLLLYPRHTHKARFPLER